MAYRKGDEPIPGYRLSDRLGKGMFGEVWKASGPGGMFVALKICSLDGDAGWKEYRGLKRMESIRHPNLISITALWMVDEEGVELTLEEQQEEARTTQSAAANALKGTILQGGPQGRRPHEMIIAMDLGEKTLEARLRECRANGMVGIPPDELFRYLEPAAQAIDFLNEPRHDLGRGPTSPIYHCDIKPANILVIGNSAKVCDFGVVKEGGNVQKTAVGATLAYAPPELITRQPPTATTDQYSLAVTYVELRTGRLPFHDPESSADVLNAHLNGDLNLADLTPAEQEVVRKATSTDPAQRYKSTLKMVQKLRQACEDELEPSSVRTPRRSREEDGTELLPGYRLYERMVQTAHERSWAARGPDGQGVMLLIHDAASAPVDLDAIAAVRALPADEGLVPIRNVWLLDDEYREIAAAPADGSPAKPLAKLVISTDLTQETLADRSAQYINRTRQGIPPGELLDYLDQVARALDALNAPKSSEGGSNYSIVHCQIRPHNVILQHGRALLTNFAAAHLLRGEMASVPFGSVPREAPFMPPEVRDGMISLRSDQYSLAISYVQLRTGKTTLGSTRGSKGHLRSTPKSSSALFAGLDLTGLSAAELTVIERALSTDPAARFENCQALMSALRQTKPQPIAVAAPNLETQWVQPDPNDPGATMLRDTPTATVSAPTKVEKPKATDDDKARRRFRRRMLAVALGLGVLVPALVFGGWMIVSRIVTAQQLATLRERIQDAEGFSPFEAGRACLNEIHDNATYAANPEFATLLQRAAEVFVKAGEEALSAENSLIGTVSKANDWATLERARDTEKNAQLTFCNDKRLQPLLTCTAINDKTAEEVRRIADGLNSLAAQLREEMQKSASALVAPMAEFEKTLDSESGPTTEDLEKRSRELQAANEQVAKLGVEIDPELDVRLKLLGCRMQSRLGQPFDLGKLSSNVWKFKFEEPQQQNRYAAEVAVMDAWRQYKSNTDLKGSLEKLEESKAYFRALRPGWEKERLEELTSLGLASTDSAIQSLAGALRPSERMTALLNQAEELLQANDWAKLAGVLGELEGIKNLPSRENQEFQRLKVLSVLLNPESSPQANADALTSLEGLLQEDGVKRASLIDAADKLSQRDDQYLERALALASMAHRIDQSPETEQMLAALYTRRAEQLIQGSPLPADDKQPVTDEGAAEYFAQLHKFCEAASKDGVQAPLIRIAEAECLATAGKPISSDLRAVVAQSLPAAAEDAPNHDLYRQYVMVRTEKPPLRVTDANTPEVQALNHLAEAAHQSTPSFGFAVPYRRHELARILIESAIALRTGGEGTLAAITQPYGPDGADRAARANDWLWGAQKMRFAGNLASPWRVNVVLAAYHKGPGHPAATDATAFANGLPALLKKENELGDDRLPLLYVNARVNADKPTGVQSAADLAESRLAASSLSDSDAIEIYNALIVPPIEALSKVDETNTALTKQLARLLYRQCRVLREHDRAEWPEGDTAQRASTAWAAIERAVKLDPNTAEYWSEQGMARLKWHTRELDKALADGDRAVQLNPKFYEGHVVRGNALLRKARRESDYDAAAKLLESSLEANQTAVSVANNPFSRYYCLLDMATTYVEWANSVDPNQRDPEALLNEAVKTIEKALEVDTTAYRNRAYSTLGNAYEDLAWLVRRNDKKVISQYYDLALEQFTKAIDEPTGRLRPESWINRGRCYYKREADSHQTDQGYMALAEQDLREALARDSKSIPANGWMGRVQLYKALQVAKTAQADQAQPLFQQAEAHFKEAIELGRQNNDYDTPVWALEWAGVRLEDPKFPPKELIQRISKLIETAATDAPGHTGYINGLHFCLGQAYLKEKEFNTESATYAKVIPADLKDVRSLENSMFKLLRAQALALTNRPAADKKPDLDLAIRTINRAIELSQPWTDAETYYVAMLPAYFRAKFPPPADANWKAVTDIGAAMERASDHSELKYSWLKLYLRVVTDALSSVKDPGQFNALLTESKGIVQRAIARAANQTEKQELAEYQRTLSAIKPRTAAPPDAAPKAAAAK